MRQVFESVAVLVFCVAITTVTAFVPISTTTCRTRTRRTHHHNMFTGIVEEMGIVQSLEQCDDMTLWDGTKGTGTELTVQGNIVLDGAYLG